MASKKSVSIEHTIDRVGVSWRKSQLTGKLNKCVVEMRPPNWIWKLHFGSYDTEVEAMIARDYGALLRVSAGEDDTSAGGFNFDDHLSICEFDESHVIFKSMDIFKVRCDEYKRLLTLYNQQLKEKCGANSPYKEFCKEARNDIAIAIEEFRRRYPHKFVNCWPATEAAKGLQNVDGSLDGGTYFTPPSSNFEVGSSQSLQSSMMADNNQKFEHFMPGVHEYHKENFPSGIATFNHLSSSPDDKSCHVIRGFHGDSMFDGGSQETSPWIKENSNTKIKKDSKSLLQVQLANCNSLEPCHEGSKTQDGGGPMARFSSSPRSSYESYSTQLASFKCVVTPNCDPWMMSPTSITYSGAPGSLSAGTSVEDETGLSSNNRNNCRQELAQIEEQFAEGEGVHPQLASSSHIEMGEVADHDTNRVSECYMQNNDQNVMPDNYQWLKDAFPLNGDECLEDHTAMDIDEMVNMDIPVQSIIDIPRESNHAPSRMLATTPNSTSQVLRTVSKVEVMDKVVSKVEVTEKVVSKGAFNEVMSKAEMVEKRFKSNTSLAKGYSALSAQRQALLAARLELERVKLDVVMQQNNKLKIANLRMAKDDGVISDEEYIQHVKALLNL